MSVFESGRGKISALSFPADPGRPLVVCIHGGSYTSHYFNFACQRPYDLVSLARTFGYPCLAIDRPGYGAGKNLTQSFSEQANSIAEEIAASLAAGITRTNKVFIAGHSIGAMIAMTMAATGQKFDLIGLDLNGAGTRYRQAAKAGLQAALKLSSPPVAPDRERRLARMFGPKGTYTEAVAEEDLATAPNSRPHELSEALIWDVDCKAVMPRVSVPVRFSLGEFDALWQSDPAALDEAAGLFGSASRLDISIVGNAGHCVHLHKSGRAHNLRTLAFIDECVIASEKNA